MIRVATFAAGSFVLVYLSRSSLVAIRSHGFYRFFAWECILGLWCLNFVGLEQWFRDPLSIRQVVSWILLSGSILPVVAGVHQLKTAGEPSRVARADASHLLPFERTTHLVTKGVYRYIRHPMYSSLLLLAWGVFFKRLSWAGAALAGGATLSLLATAKAEEREDVQYFGPEYETYMTRTKRFLPFVL